MKNATMISRRSFLKAAMAASAVSALALTGCGGAASSTVAASSTASSAAAEGGQTFKVGIVNYVDHASLNQIVASVESRLDELGKEKGVTFDYADYYANAQADQSNLNQIGPDLVADGVDEIVAVPTPTAATMLAAVEDTDIPVVYSAVTDPAAAGFDTEPNITGTSDALNTDAIMNLILAVNPDIDTIGLLYDLSQDASTQAIADAKAGISGAKSDYDSTFSVKAKELKKTVSGILDSLDGISGDLDSAVDGLTDASGSLAKGLSKAAKLVNKASDQLGEASDKISAFKDELDGALISDDLATIKTMIGNDPEGLAVSLSGPVALDRKPVYPIRNYGSAMAPFYTILSLWVGSIVLAAMMKVSVDDELINELIPVRLHEIYLGRYLFFGGLALLQATLVCAGDTLLLIDAGISCRRIEQSLRALGRTLGDLTAVFITHEHADHVGGLATLSKKSAAPVYVTRGVSHILTCPVVAFTAGDTLEFAGCTVRSFSTSHDAVDPVGYRVDAADGSLGILTDTGFVTGAAREALAGVDTLLLEANHDVETLQYGPYPYFLKRRILGDEGHLSNDAAAEFARLAVQSGTRDILLAHLSKENNTPELAEYAVARALQSAGLSVRLGVAPRDTMSEVHLCRRSPSFASEN